jgi:ATP-dependent DNA ligase
MGIQKAKHLFLEMEKKTPNINKMYMMFEKHDGWFGYLDFPSCIIHSRQQREIPSVKELSNLIREKRPQVKGRLIFEIMIDGYEIDRFHELNGILNRKFEQAEDVYLRVHDFIPEFNFCKMSAQNRYMFAEEIVHRINLPQVRLSHCLGVSNNPNIWQEKAELIQSNGGEGLILKSIDDLYSAGKRISSLMKIKEEVTVEMIVTEVIEGQGEHEGMAGKLICKDETDMLHEVGMGCMSHSDRFEVLEKPHLLVGKVVEIKAMKKLSNGSYREPRFKAQRYDKGVHELG